MVIKHDLLVISHDLLVLSWDLMGFNPFILIPTAAPP